MVEPDAQGRLPGIAPVTVVDIGSNSIRIVVYEGMNRSPAVLFNEKMLCGLGRGVASTGRMEPESIAKALKALTRFKGSVRSGARPQDVCAGNCRRTRGLQRFGNSFQEAEAILGLPDPCPDRPEEAMFSALGVITVSTIPTASSATWAGALAGADQCPGRQLRLRHHAAARRPASRRSLRQLDREGDSALPQDVEGRDMAVCRRGTRLLCGGWHMRALAKLHMD